jgi:sugar phosphate isomerase/epimerase
MLRYGYNTNGFAHHRLGHALRILAELGYGSVALTLDVHALNPFDANFDLQFAAADSLLRELNLRCVIETGARFALDPWRKHQPTLVSADEGGRTVRLGYLKAAVAVAQHLRADAVSFWSGTPDEDAPDEVLMDRLTAGCRDLCEYAEPRGVRLAFEPEPGMFIDTMTRYAELRRRVDHPAFGLTLDVGHLHCLGEVPIEEQIHAWKHLLWNVHIEDMRHGVHDHLMFGEGEIDFPPVLKALRDVGYQGGVHVELSRHSHDAVETARKALAFLREH